VITFLEDRLLQHESLEDGSADSGGALRVCPGRHAAVALPAAEKPGEDLDGLVEAAADDLHDAVVTQGLPP
jgi:hypothetical protein